MERIVFKLIDLSQIKSGTYSTRWSSPVPDALANSIRKRGILQPCMIAKDGSLLAGQRRLSAAIKAGLKELPVLEIQEMLSPQDSFVTAVLMNWKQEWSEMDRVFVIKKAVSEFRLNESVILEEILPALGLESKPWILKEYEEISRLEADLLNQVAAGNLPFRGMNALSSFSSNDQKVFAGFASRMALTTNQLIHSAEWLTDLIKQEKSGLKDFFAKYQMDKVWGDDKKANTDAFVRKLRALRFPHLAEKEKQFESLSGRLRQGIPEVSLEAPPYFEAEGLTLRAKARDADALKGVLAKIERHKELLNSLFDVLL